MMSRLATQQAHLRSRPVVERDPELDAYNAAFDELELDWHWDAAVLHELAGISCEKERICAYLRAHRPHLLSVYDAGALAEHIVEARERIRARRLGRPN